MNKPVSNKFIKAKDVKVGMTIYPDFSKDYRKQNQKNIGNETLRVTTFYSDGKPHINFIERDGWTAAFDPEDDVEIITFLK